MASIASLTLVLSLLAGLLWWLRRAIVGAAGAGHYIRVVETVVLGPGKCLHLVRCAGRGLLIASSGQRCDLLCELEDLPAESPDAEPSWMDALRSRLGKL